MQGLVALAREGMQMRRISQLTTVGLKHQDTGREAPGAG